MIGFILAPFIISLNVYLALCWYKFIVKHNDSFFKYLGFLTLLPTLNIGVAYFLPKSCLKTLLSKIAAYWLGVSLYLILFIFIALLVLYFVKENKYKFQKIAIFLVIGGTILISSIGIYNANNVKTVHYNVDINANSSFKIAFISDLHLGISIDEKHLKKVVDQINDENADIVLIGGDIFDNDYNNIANPDLLIDLFKQINTKYGVYAVLGNHDVQEKIFCGFTFNNKEASISEDMLNFLEESNIKLLYDEAIYIDDVVIYGRPDTQKINFGNDTRASIYDICQKYNDRALIVIDHQPSDYLNMIKYGVDLCLSGHTHRGQLFPLNMITSLINENNYGLYKKENFSAITSSGVGIFGPMMRVGSSSELVIIDVNFNN